MIAVYLGLVFTMFLGDVSIKNLVEKRDFRNSGPKPLCGGRIFLKKCHNYGMAFNLAETKTGLVTGLSVVLTAVSTVVFLFSLGKRGNGLLRLGLSLLLGGAFSNTYDRLRRKYVVDYISFPVKWKWLRELVFNLADFGIITGALLAALGAAQ